MNAYIAGLGQNASATGSRGVHPPDNWDLQAIEIDGQDTQGILPVVKMSNGPVSGTTAWPD